MTDDASTDDSLERLRKADAACGRVRVISLPHNSGWPGKPRNVGTEAALGRYAMYVDQLFMTEAYLAASSCSIVADYICYRYLRQPGGGNAGSHRVPPADYYSNLRDVLDVVDRYTPPGAERDRFYRRFLRTEVLSRLGGRRLARMRAAQRTETLDAIRPLLANRFGPGVDAGLPPLLRQRAQLARHGTIGDLRELAARVQQLKPAVLLEAVDVGMDGCARIGVTVEFELDGTSLLLERSGGDLHLPLALTGAGVSSSLRRVEALDAMVVDGVVKYRRLLDEWFLPGSWRPVLVDEEGGTRLRWRGSVMLDPERVAGGRAVREGVHDLLVRVEAFGLNRTVAISVPEQRRHLSWLLGGLRFTGVVYSTRNRKLRLRSRGRAPKIKEILDLALRPIGQRPGGGRRRVGRQALTETEQMPRSADREPRGRSDRAWRAG